MFLKRWLLAPYAMHDSALGCPLVPKALTFRALLDSQFKLVFNYFQTRKLYE